MSRRSRLIRSFTRAYDRAARSDQSAYWTHVRIVAWDDLVDIHAMRFVRNVRRWRG